MASYTRIGTASLRQLPFDFKGNVARILTAIERAQKANINVLLLPEMALTGYGCEDNFTFQEFNETVQESLRHIVNQLTAQPSSKDNTFVVSLGLPLMFPGGQVYNASAIISGQGLHGFSCKQFLARNGLHYEPRWFEAWPRGRVITHPEFDVPMGDIVVEAQGLRIGFETCEDSWISNRPGRDLYQRNVDVILNPSASHFATGKFQMREQFIIEGSRAFGVAYAYANLNGTENGTSIFDAGCLIASEGKIISRGERLGVEPILLNHELVSVSANRVNRIISSESIENNDTNVVPLPLKLLIQSENIDVHGLLQQNSDANPIQSSCWDRLPEDDQAFQEICYAISNGLWDWMTRTKTHGFVVSLSGGADSGLVVALVYLSQVIALEQLGVKEYVAQLPIDIHDELPELNFTHERIQWLKIHVMPKVLMTVYQGTENSSDITLNAAKQLAQEVGATFHQWRVDALVQHYTDLVNSVYPDQPLNWDTDDITLQNIQARSRSPGIWMLANRENKLLIATSNLSESALGYATMDGDTSGVLSAVSGISKTTIRKLNMWLEKTGITLNSNANEELENVRLPALKWINAQQPTAELRPVEQTDEEDLMPYEICDFIMDRYLVKQMWPRSILVELVMHGFDKRYDINTLANFIQRWFTLFCRNPWKRYGIRAGFHIEQISLDPKTFHRFPLLNSGFEEPLKQMWDYVKKQG